MGKSKKLIFNEHELLFHFRSVMLIVYFFNLIPIFLVINIICDKYGLDIIFSLIIFLVYMCVHLKFYNKYRAYFDFD